MPSLLFLMYAACSGRPTTTTTAEVVPVPLTAATASVALQQISREEITPPWSLTASDGSGLALTRVDAKAVFEGPLAFTELHLYFHNAENRRREGTFQITLPPNAAVSRFAMETDGQMMEAEVVEKQLARRAYDDFLHRRQDPALLEKAEGNQFTAKVFPIAPNADKHIVISFSQALPGAQYVLPLRGLPKTARVDVELGLATPDGQRTTQDLHQQDWTPDHDFVSTLAAGAAAITTGNLVAAQVSAFDDVATTSEAPQEMTILVDTSASRGLGYAGYVEHVHGLITRLAAKYGAQLPLQVVAFDQDAEQIFAGPASEWGAAHDKKLVERGAAGASDLAQALGWLGARGAKSRVLVVTDGVITAGAEHAELAAALKQLAGVQRVDVALAGGIRDEAAIAGLVKTGLPHAGAVLDLDQGTDGVVAALGEPVVTDVPVSVAGATWVWPKTISSARRGTSTMVYARMAKPTQQIDVSVGKVHHQLSLLAGTQPLIERAVASAEIDELDARLADAKGDEAKAIKKAIVDKSVAARVVSSQTSLLVLESDADYARYGIDRKGLADILEVGPKGLERHHRVAAPAQIAAPQPVGQKQQPMTGDATKKGDFKELAKEEKSKLKNLDEDDGKDQFEVTGVKELAPGRPAENRPEPKADPASLVVDKVPPMVEPPKAPAPPPPPPPPPPPSMHVSAGSGASVRGGESEVSGRVQRPSVTVARDSDGEGDEGGLNREAWPPRDAPVALTGQLAAIEQKLTRADVDGALNLARDWHAKEPGNVLALIGLGDALEAKHSLVTASRIYGSIIDLFPGRADLRRFAGERLARVAAKQGADAQHLIVDTYQRAVADRPDHLTGHRLLAYALVRAGNPAEAFAAILSAIDQPYRNDSYRGGERVLADDAGMIGAAYIAAEPGKRKEVTAELAKRNLAVATQPSTRFILYWETDANDVDFHIQDARGGHAWYSSMHLPSGGDLYADITTGYGPECFAIQGKPTAGPYRLSINYYSQGPMGYGMGLLEVQRFDGKGGFAFDERPYVIMNDHAYVDLGKFQ